MMATSLPAAKSLIPDLGHVFEGGLAASGCLSAPLSIVTGQDATNGEILVEVGPVQTEGRKLHTTQLLFRLAFEPGVAADGECDLEPGVHFDVDPAGLMPGLYGLVNQSTHATCRV